MKNYFFKYRKEIDDALETIEDVLEDIDEMVGTFFNDDVYEALDTLKKYFNEMLTEEV